MPVRSAPGLADCIRSAVHRVTTPTDADLLAAFVRDRDPAAFEALVRRHGPLVANVCRGVLPNPADADDAAQATFLVLSRKAAAVRGETLPGWLFRVARRAAVEVRRLADHRRRFEAAGARAEAVVGPDLSWREAVALLHEELDRLPAKYRDPLILCYLDGRPRDEAATALRCSVDTLRGRLDRGRAKLGARLRKRGVTLSAGLLAAVAGPRLAPAEVARRVLSPSASVVAVARAVSAPARGWIAGGVATMAAALVIGVAMAQVGTADPPKAADPPSKVAAPRLDHFGDPLPDGAMLRLGTVGFRLPNVTGVGFRKTGELVAFSQDRTLHVWPADLTAKPKVATAGRAGYYGFSRALSADGRFAAAVESDGRIIVWDATGDQLVEYLSREARDARYSVFSPNGTWLAVNASGILLCNLAARTWVKLDGPDYTDCLSFTPDGKWLAVTTDRDVLVFETATAKLRCRVVVPKVRPQFAAVSPDGSTLAVLPTQWLRGPETAVRLLSIPSGEPVEGRTGPPGPARWVGFPPDGRTIWTGGPQGAKEWDPAAGKVVREIAGPAQAPLVYSADGKRFASRTECAVQVWDAASGKPVRPDLAAAGHTGAIWGITVSPDGKYVATNDQDGEIWVWAADTGRPLSRARSGWGFDRRIAFLPDGQSYVAVAEDYVTPVVRDSVTGRELRRFTVPPEVVKADTTRDLRLSADGKWLTTSARPVRAGDKAYQVRWDVGTGRMAERTEESHNWRDDDFMPAAKSLDGRWRVQGGKVARVGTKDEIEVVPAAESYFVVPKFSDDSRLVGVPRTPRSTLMGGPPDGSLVIFDLDRKAQVSELPTGEVTQHAFSPDGRSVVAISRHEIVVWELATGKPTRQFRSGHFHRSRAVGVAFIPDGRRLITGHEDCSALVWDLTGTGRASGPAPALPAAELAQLWDDLLSEDAARAHVAGWELADRPAEAIALIAARLKPAQATDPATVRGLVAKLDAKGFAAREAAEKGLRDLGDAAVPTLRELVKEKLSAEQRERMDRVLATATAAAPPAGERLREVRAVAVLERAMAKDVLRKLADGLPDARLTHEARAALKRIER
jgi:RNA polymerase sigma factor (sigma-70 family)